jgi:hypothetical protein
VNLDASLTHKVAGWERVMEKAFFVQQPAIERGPSYEDPLQDLTDAYNDRGYTFQVDRRKHAVRILGREVQTSHELSSADIQQLLRDLRPDQTYGEVIEAEVAEAREPDNRIEPGDEALPSGLVEMGRRMENTKARTQDNYGTARSYGRYNPPTKHR